MKREKKEVDTKVVSNGCSNITTLFSQACGLYINFFLLVLVHQKRMSKLAHLVIEGWPVFVIWKKKTKKNYVLIKDTHMTSPNKVDGRHDNGWCIITILALSLTSISAQEFPSRKIW